MLDVVVGEADNESLLILVHIITYGGNIFFIKVL